MPTPRVEPRGPAGPGSNGGDAWPPASPALDQVLAEVAAERARQDELWGDANPLYRSPTEALIVLMEEVGEMAKAVIEGDLDGLRAEAVQVAAVAVAITERLRSTGDGTRWR